jgi:DNA polymerase-3 subunit beta
LPALALLQGVAEKRSSLPILTHVYLKTHVDGILELRATDLEIGLRCSCPATVKTAGACTVEARRFYDIVRALPAGDLRLDVSGADTTSSALTLVHHKSRFRLFSLDPHEFPQLVSADSTEHTIQMPAATLREMIDKTLFSAVNDDTRLNLHGVLFEPCEGERLRMVASDGHRLAVVERHTPGLPVDASSVLLPFKGVAEARKLLECAQDELVTLALGKAVATLTVANTMLTLRFVETQFPDYRNVLPTRHAHRLSVARAELLAAMRRLLVMTTERGRGVELNIRSGSMELSVKTIELGDGTDEIPVEYTGGGITVGFNGRYLLDWLLAVETAERVTIELAEPTTPGLLLVDNDDDYRYVVMPMRID